MHVRTTAAELARWLESRGGLWVVEGEPTLARSLPSPADAVALSAALRRAPGASGYLAIFAPEECGLCEGDAVAADALREAAHEVDGHKVFQLCWLDHDGTMKDSWLLAEHASSIGSRTPSGVAAVVSSWRSGAQSSSPLIRRKPS